MKNNIHNYLFKRFKPYSFTIELSKKVLFPFMGGVPIYYVVKIFFRNLGKESLSYRASSVAFNLFLSLFPSLIFLFSLLPYIPVKNLNEMIMDSLAVLMPYNAFVAIQDTLRDILERPRGDLLSFSLFASLYFASNGVFGIMDAFDRNDKRSFWKRRLIAIALTISLGAILVSGLTILLVSEITVQYIIEHSFISDTFTKTMVLGMQWIMLFLLIFITCTLMYRHGDSRVERWKHIYPGAVMASLLAVATSLAYALYVERFANYNKLYGSLGALIITMLWLYINSLMLIIGHEFNRSLKHTHMALNRKNWLTNR